MKIILNEDEKNQISSQHDGIDRQLFNFLLRRLKVNERELGGDWGDMKPFKTTEYSFESLPGYGFNSFMSKKDMEKRIITMLYEKDIIDWIYDMDEQNPERVKIVKTIRKFLNFMLSDQK
jgi:hypothetical protein